MNNTEDKTSDPLYSGLDSKTADQGFKETGGTAFPRPDVVWNLPNGTQTVTVGGRYINST